MPLTASPPWRTVLRPSRHLVAAIGLVLLFRIAAWYLRDALHQPDAGMRGALKGIAWDIALVAGLYALARGAALSSIAVVRRGVPIAVGGVLALATCIRALDVGSCYLTQSHWNADGFLYFDPAWAVRALEPSVQVLLVCLTLAIAVHVRALARDGAWLRDRLAGTPARMVVLPLALALLPGAWAVRDGLAFPAALDDLRLIPEINFARQWRIWRVTARVQDVPKLEPALRARLLELGLMPAQSAEPGYPLSQARLAEPPLAFAARPGIDPRPNVVLTLAEGLDAAFVFALSGRFEGVMPELSALAGQMSAVTGFHATASPTIAGLVTTLCGIHPPAHPRDLAPGRSVGGNTAYTCLPDLLRQHGYRTVFVQSTSKEVMGLEHFLRTHGVDEVHARLEFEQRFAGRATGAWGMYDDALVEYTTEQVRRLEALRAQDGRPFLLINLTLETHDPGMSAPGCELPALQGEVPDAAGSRQLLASYHCSDKAIGRLGRFLLAPERRERTMWLLTADHAQFSTVNSRPLFADGKRQFDAVPWLLHDPLHELPARVEVLAGTTDTAPTLLHLLGMTEMRHALTGHSIFGSRPALPVLVGRIGARFAYLQGPTARVELSQGELQRRCADGRALAEAAPLSACELLGWLAWQDALWDAGRLFPRGWYLGDKGADRGRLEAEIGGP